MDVRGHVIFFGFFNVGQIPSRYGFDRFPSGTFQAGFGNVNILADNNF